MIPLSPEEAGQALGTPPLRSAVGGVSVDTRNLRPGDLFIALVGERFDGHEYVSAALAAGACGAVVSTGHSIAGINEIEKQGRSNLIYPVNSPLLALGALARAVRRRSQAVVIAVTGSVGKTGTKDLIRAMAGMERVVLATESNLNNEIGVPLTLLQIDKATEIVVLEMGMRGLGQIAYLADVAEPDVGVITNVAPVHLELLGSLDNVAQAKGELLMRLKPDGVGVVPVQCPSLDPWVEQCGRRVVRFLLRDTREHLDAAVAIEGKRSDVVGQITACDMGRCLLNMKWPEGETEAITPFAARYRLENAVAAAAACYAAGLSLAQCLAGIGGVVFTPGRGDEYDVGGLVILDDTYNANPEAVAVALTDLVQRAREVGGRPVAVLGDMLELGADTSYYHAEAGRCAAQAGTRVLYAVGDQAEIMRDAFLEVADDGRVAVALPLGELESLVAELKTHLNPGDVVLVKGSRRLGLERVVQGLLRLAGGEC
ncbi:MAG: UDP-N-acetylmuramoyl-tripeptide--D-alanyl-D-alanine ligase [Actinobacteria bacterium]|nr:UDP-N-acetylmuramoyl-tripeptide--D-alanyl-D-alanine ligase [Actinomycetota bacterium]